MILPYLKVVSIARILGCGQSIGISEATEHIIWFEKTVDSEDNSVSESADSSVCFDEHIAFT